jgi:acyl-CoA thioester hydrolase
MKPPTIPLEKILALEPACLRTTVPEASRDENGHMNVRWYATIFDEGGDTLHERLGLTPQFHKALGTGTMDLENHFFSRLVAHSPTRMHYLLFMVDESSRGLAAIFECINSLADLKLRKTAPFPAEVAARIEAGVTAGAALDWPPPVCGAMRA